MMTNHQKRTKRNGIEGRTEGIPNFTFKQAIQLVVGFLLVFVVGAYLIEVVPSIFAFPVLVLMAVGMGFTVSYIQYGWKTEVNKTFWIIGILISILALIILSIYYYYNILI